MQQAWEDVEKLLTEVRPHLLRAGIPERQLKMPEAKPEDIKSERYVEIFDWLHKLKTGPEYTKLMKVWRLVAPEVWQGYIDNEIKGLQEQKLLEAAQIDIRKAWKLNRPFFFGRKFKSNGDSNENPTDEKSEAAAAADQDGDSQSPEGRGVRSKRKRTPPHHRRRGRPAVLRGEGEGISDGGPGESSGSE